MRTAQFPVDENRGLPNFHFRNLMSFCEFQQDHQRKKCNQQNFSETSCSFHPHPQDLPGSSFVSFEPFFFSLPKICHNFRWSLGSLPFLLMCVFFWWQKQRLKVNIDVLEADLILLPRQGFNRVNYGDRWMLGEGIWYHEALWCHRNSLDGRNPAN